MPTNRPLFSLLLLAALTACGDRESDATTAGDEPPAEGVASPVADAPPASIENPASPPPVGTDVGAASGDTASVVVDTTAPGVSRR